MSDEKFNDLLENIPPAKDLYKDIIIRRQQRKDDELMSHIKFMLDTLLNSTDEYVSFYMNKEFIRNKVFNDMVSNLTKKGYNVYIDDDSISICYGYVKPLPTKKNNRYLDFAAAAAGVFIGGACYLLFSKRLQ